MDDIPAFLPSKPLLTSKLKRLSPTISTVKVLLEARAILPMEATITPLLLTSLPASTAYPDPTEIFPEFETILLLSLATLNL